MRPLVSKTRQFLRIAKFSPIFKEAEVLPRRLPNFGKANNFLCLTIELSFFFKHTWIKLRRENYFVRLVQVSTYDFETKLFFSRSIWPFFLWFLQWKRGIRREFFGNAYDSYPGSGYRHQFSSEETEARQSPSLASMEARQSPLLASIPSVESSNSGGNNNTNDSKGKKKVKHETWWQAEQKLLVQLWAENHELLESRGPEPHGGKSRKSWTLV